MKRLAVGILVTVLAIACRDAVGNDSARTRGKASALFAASSDPCSAAADAARDAARAYSSATNQVRQSGSGAVADAATAYATLASLHSAMISACLGGTPYTVGGTVSGLTSGRSVALRNNGGADLVVSANGPFTFPVSVVDGGAYNVTVGTQPVGEICSVSSGTGAIAGANVTSVAVTCVGAAAPNVGDLVVTEIMVDPLAVSDANGEYFEILNTSSNPIELQGLQIRDDANTGFTIATSLVVAPGGFVVFGTNGNFGTNGGVVVNYVYSGFSLTNTGDQIEIFSGATSLDRVAYVGSFPLTPGHAMLLRPGFENVVLNDNGANWCSAAGSLPGGDFGSPGSGNSCP